MVTLSSTKEARIYNGKKITSLTSGVGKIGQPLAYGLLKRQVRWSGIPISFRTFQFVVIHIVKGFSIVNEAKVDPSFLFLELLLFL